MGQFEVVFKSLIEGKTTYFTKITAEDREKVKKWIAEQNGVCLNDVGVTDGTFP